MNFCKILFFFFVILLHSCVPHHTEVEMEVETRPIATFGVYVNEDGSVDSICSCYKGIAYTKIYLEGCEYIRFGNGGYSWGAHSGLCANPIHKYNPEKQQKQ